MRTRYGDSKEEHGKVNFVCDMWGYMIASFQFDMAHNSILLGWDCKIT